MVKFSLILRIFVSMASTSRDSQESIAKATWELENNVQTVNTVDDIFKYDKQQQQDILTAKPWEKEYAYLMCYFYTC